MEAGAENALARSDFSYIFRCITQLPKHALHQAPWLYVYHCWTLILIGTIEAVESLMVDPDWLVESVGDNEEQKQLMQGYIAGIQYHIYVWKRDYDRMRAFDNRAIELMPENHWVKAYCYMGTGVSYWATGDLESAVDAFKKAYTVGDVTGNARVAVTASIYLMHSLELQGHHSQSLALMNQVIQDFTVNGRSLPVTAYAHVDMNRVLIEKNELDLASKHLTQGLEYCQLLGDNRMGKLGHYLMARIEIAR